MCRAHAEATTGPEEMAQAASWAGANSTIYFLHNTSSQLSAGLSVHNGVCPDSASSSPCHLCSVS